MTDDGATVRILASRATAQRLNRRMLLRGMSAAAMGSLLASCGDDSSSPSSESGKEGSAGELENQLNMYSWGDYDDPGVLKSFQKSNNLRMQIDSFGSNEELISKLAAARGTGGYDIVVPTGVFVPQMAQNDLLERLDLDLIPNVKHVDPSFLKQAWDPKNEYSICKAWGTTGYVYDKRKISRELTTWGDFLDAAAQEASGSTSVLDDPKDVTGIYFWANDIDWNTTDAAQLDACEKYLVENLAPHIKAFDSYPGSGAIAQDSHALIQCWNGDARQGMLESKDPGHWQWVLPGPTTEIWMDNWAIAKGAPHPNAAHAFINYVLDPKVSLQEVTYIGYHTGVAGIEPSAREADLPLLDLVFFSQDQLDSMVEGAVNDAQQRNVDIYNALKAAAGA
jgi:spermidine/putrescine transport system substrate-binding protein